MAFFNDDKYNASRNNPRPQRPSAGASGGIAAPFGQARFAGNDDLFQTLLAKEIGAFGQRGSAAPMQPGQGQRGFPVPGMMSPFGGRAADVMAGFRPTAGRGTAEALGRQDLERSAAARQGIPFNPIGPGKPFPYAEAPPAPKIEAQRSQSLLPPGVPPGSIPINAGINPNLWAYITPDGKTVRGMRGGGEVQGTVVTPENDLPVPGPGDWQERPQPTPGPRAPGDGDSSEPDDGPRHDPNPGPPRPPGTPDLPAPPLPKPPPFPDYPPRPWPENEVPQYTPPPPPVQAPRPVAPPMPDINDAIRRALGNRSGGFGY